MSSILKLKNVNAYYDKSHILFDLNVNVDEGRSICILGRNGVGKSTTMKTIMGIMNPQNHNRTEGEIIFDNKNIVGLKTYQIAKQGISYVPQGRHIFPNLTTKENLLISMKKGVDGSEFWTLNRIYELFPQLKDRESSMAGKLSGGEQQMLAIARGLVQNPKLLLMDEITEGLAPIIVKQLADIVKELIKRGTTILLAEQNYKFALEVSDYIYILEKGTVVHECASSDLSNEILMKYLGT